MVLTIVTQSLEGGEICYWTDWLNPLQSGPDKISSLCPMPYTGIGAITWEETNIQVTRAALRMAPA